MGVNLLDGLIRLFNQERRQRLMRLLTIPRAAVRGAKSGDDVNQRLELAVALPGRVVCLDHVSPPIAHSTAYSFSA